MRSRYMQLVDKSIECMVSAIEIYNKPDFISYSIKSLPTQRIDNLKKKGIFIAGWIIKDNKDYDFAKDYCDCLIAENMEKYL